MEVVTVVEIFAHIFCLWLSTVRANLPDDPVMSMAFKFLALITVTVSRPAVGR